MNLMTSSLSTEMEKKMRLFDKSIGTGTESDNHAFVYCMIERLFVTSLQKKMPVGIHVRCNHPQNMWYLADVSVQNDQQNGNLTIYIADPAPLFTVRVDGDFDEAIANQIADHFVDFGLDLIPCSFASETLYDGVLAAENEKTTWFNRFFGYGV